MAASWEPAEDQGVVLQFVGIIFLLNVHVGMVYFYQPHTVRSHVWIEIAFSTLVTVVLLLRMLAVPGSSEMLIFGTSLVLIMYCYILLIGTKVSDDLNAGDVAAETYERPRERLGVSPSRPPAHRATADEENTQFMYDLLPVKQERRQPRAIDVASLTQ